MLLRPIVAIWLALTACQGGVSPSRQLTALEAYKAKQYAKCAELFTAQAKRGGAQQATAYYSAACCFALDGKPDAAFAALDRGVKSGLNDVHIGIDEDLASLRTDPRWGALWQAVQAAHEAAELSVRDKPLRAELLALMQEDQAVRNQFIANMKDPTALAHMKEVDRKTTARLKEVIAKQGWPGKSLVGEEAAEAAWLLVQHADADRAFQRECLSLIERAAVSGEASKADYAYLYDRIAVAENRPQRYGTQYRDNKPAPIEDEAHVDERRKAVGLGTMAEYDAQMRKK